MNDVRRVEWADGSVHQCTCKGATVDPYAVEPDCIAHEYVWKADDRGEVFREKTAAAKRGNA